MNYTDEEKETLVIQFINNYKNKEFTADEVKEKYGLAVKYMLENFDAIISNNTFNGNISSFSEGDRSISYNNDYLSIVGTNPILKALLGNPFLRLY